MTFKRNDKLINVLFHEGSYHLFEPQNVGQSKYNIIDNNLWLACKFMPDKQIEVKEGDVIRFGRIPFKIAKLVLDPILNRSNVSIGDASNDISRIDDIPDDNQNIGNRSVTQTNHNNMSSFRNLTAQVNNTTVIDDG